MQASSPKAPHGASSSQEPYDTRGEPVRLDPILHVLGEDPVDWVLDSDEPFARWVMRVHVLGESPTAPAVAAEREAVVVDPRVRSLVADMPAWEEATESSGHHSPLYLPNRLNLLADMGVTGGDFPEIDAVLDSMLAHQDKFGRFEAIGSYPRRSRPEWGSLLCDTNVITDVLLRYGRGGDPRVVKALGRMREDLGTTPQGRAWQCIPERRTLFRGPGRKADVCPQVTLEGLRAFSHDSAAPRPDWLLDAARTPLAVWRRRTEERPYEFGHGYQFKSVKWPHFWYDVLWVVDTVGRYPEVFASERAAEEDRTALAEMAACLIAYNFDDAGRVVPRRAYRGFEQFSFGQKKEPSPFATAIALAALARLTPLADEIARVDVSSLPSSKGGSGTPVPPKGRSAPCPVPVAMSTHPVERSLARVLARHHLGTPWEAVSLESLTADVVGWQATLPATPYASIRARLPEFERGQLDAALYERHALVRYRCMRGNMYLLRPDMLQVAVAATRRQTVRYAMEYARFRGITPAVFERFVPEVLDALQDAPLTTAAIRQRLGARLEFDVAALVNLMATEGILLRDRPAGTWLDRQWTYIPTDRALPGLRLDAMREPDADIALVRAYMRAFGPALAADAAWWTGLGMRRTERALEALGDEIVQVGIGSAETIHLMHVADADELAAARVPEEAEVVLLPALDPYVMGYARKDRLVSDVARPFVFDRTGNVTSVVVCRGRVAGVWDLVREPESRVRVHLIPGAYESAGPREEKPIDAATLRELATVRARELGRFWFDSDVPVEFIERMVPIASRPAGAIVKPLRM